MMKMTIRALLLAAGLFLLGLLPLGAAYEAACADRIYPGVRVWNVPVGGLRPEDAAARLAARLTTLDQPILTLRSPIGSWGVRPADLGLRLAADATARQALLVGRGPGDGPLDHLRLLLDGLDLPPILSYDETVARRYLQTLASQHIDQPPVDAALTLDGTTPVAVPARTGRALDVEATLLGLPTIAAGPLDLVLRDVPAQIFDAAPALARAQTLLAAPLSLLLPNPQQGDPGPWLLPPEELAAMLAAYPVNGQLQATLDPVKLRAYVDGLAPSLAVPPLNARFHLDDETGQLLPIAPSRAGRALDVEGSVQSILAAVDAGQNVAALVIQPAPPRYPETVAAAEAGIVQLVAEGESYFIGSPSGRDHNIRLAASQFDGLILAPGETFSFDQNVGEITAEAGYDESYVTAGEQLAIEVGGGICQVSTTAFRAALWGGYPIVERWYHYHRVEYYELRGYGPGLDATVYTPSVDFRFTNDRQAALLIETEIEDATHRLIFRFYSTDDGRRIEISEPVVSDETAPEPPIYELDEEMEAGTVVRWQSALGGLTATVERWVYDAAGNLLDHNTIVSVYTPRRAAYHYGPGYEP